MADPAAQTYANTPSDPTTWSPGFAAQMQTATAKYQADQQAQAAAATLATLQPCAVLVAATTATLIAGMKALAKATDTGGEKVSEDIFAAQLANAANALSLVAQSFATRFVAVGGSAPTS